MDTQGSNYSERPKRAETGRFRKSGKNHRASHTLYRV